MSTPHPDPETGQRPDESIADKPKNVAGDNSRQRDPGDEEGEDEGGAPKEGDYSGLNENQKPVDR